MNKQLKTQTHKQYKNNQKIYLAIIVIVSIIHSTVNNLITGQITSIQSFSNNPMVFIDIFIFGATLMALQPFVNNKRLLLFIISLFWASQLSYYANLSILDYMLTGAVFVLADYLAKKEAKRVVGIQTKTLIEA